MQEGQQGVTQDIGVGENPAVPPRTRPERRQLPVWAAIAMALLVGWVLGTATSRTATNVVEPGPVVEPTPAASPRPAASPIPAASPTPIEGPVEAVYETVTTDPAKTDPTDLLTVVMVQAPLRGVAIPADIKVIENGIATQIELDRSIAGATQGVVGQGDRRMLVVEDSVVFMAVDAVMIFDPVKKTEPVQVAKAIYLLPGSGPGLAWAVTSGSGSVIEIDVRAQVRRQEYDLNEVGAPLASYNGGLVVAPADRSLGAFALWSPARGVESLIFEEHVTFVGAAGNVLIVHTPLGLASYDTVTGVLTQTGHDLPPSAQRRSIVSPDGSHVAVAAQGSVTELPVVLIVNTMTGKQVDVFFAAFAWQLQWINQTEILFMLPKVDGVRVMLRDIADGTSLPVTDLVGPNFWVTVAG